MAKLMIFIVVVTSLTLVHADAGESSSSPSMGRAQHEQGSNFLVANSDTNTNTDNSIREGRDFATKREYDNIDLEKLNEGLRRYDLVFPNNRNGDGDDTAIMQDSASTRRQTPAEIRNLARLLYGLPQFNRFYARYQPEKRGSDLRHFLADTDDKEIGGSGTLAARIYREPSGKSTEWLVQRLRDQLQANPRTSREKRRRCQFDPNLGIKNPSSCDTDSYFGAADYTMRNVWDSAGRR